MVRVFRKARYRRVIVSRIRYVIFMDCSCPYHLIFWILFLYQEGIVTKIKIPTGKSMEVWGNARKIHERSSA